MSKNNCDIVFKCSGSLEGIGSCKYGHFTDRFRTKDFKRCEYAVKEQYSTYWECTNKTAINEQLLKIFNKNE